MKKEDTHIIKSQQYEIVLSQSANGHAYQSKISQLQQHVIQPLLQKILDTYDMPEFVDQFDQIELDLGSISSYNFERELTYKLEEAFANFFKQNTYDNGSLIKGKRQRIYYKKIEQLRFFLSNGYIKWDAASAENPSSILASLLVAQPEECVALLRKEAKKETVRKRLVSQLTTTVLEQIVNASTGQEGTYINQYNRSLRTQQHSQRLININDANYRDALWEITFQYIFVATNNYANRIHFLRYLIQKVAARYNISYKNLLNTLTKGVLKQQLQGTLYANFEHMVLELQQNEETITANIVAPSQPSQKIAILPQLTYYLAHGSFTADTTYRSKTSFYKDLIRFITQTPTTFYEFWYAHIQQSGIKSLQQRLDATVLTSIVQHAPDTTSTKIVSFINTIQQLATQHNIVSKTLKNITAQYGILALRVYQQQKTPHTIYEFLFQVLSHHIIDQGWVHLLEILSSTNAYPEKEQLQRFLKQLAWTHHIQVQNATTLDTPFLKAVVIKLYRYAPAKNQIAKHQFEETITQQHYHKETLRLLVLLLEICAKNTAYTQEAIANWMLKRISALQVPTPKAMRILEQLITINTWITIPFIVNKGIQLAQTRYTHVSDTGTTYTPVVNTNTYQQLIAQLQDVLYKRSEPNLYTSMRHLVDLFATTYALKPTEVYTQLLQQLATTDTTAPIRRILTSLAEQKDTPNTATKDLQYAIDVVYHYTLHGKLPWWATATTPAMLQEFIHKVLQQQPKTYLHWYRYSSHKSSTLNVLSKELYTLLLQHCYATTATSVIALYALLDQVVSHTLAGSAAQVASINTIRAQLVQYAYTPHKGDLSKLVQQLLDTLAAQTTMTAQLLSHIISDQILSTKRQHLTLQSIGLQLAPEAPDASPQLTQLLADKKQWEDVIRITALSSTEVFDLLKHLYQQTPKTLQFYLEKTTFRTKILERLSIRKAKALIALILPTNQHTNFDTAWELLQKTRTLVKATPLHIMQHTLMDLVLLKTTIVPQMTHWSTEDWGRLVLQSLNSIHAYATPKALIQELKIHIPPDTHPLFTAVLQQAKTLTAPTTLETESSNVLVEEISEGSIYINNAGMILLGPYIGMLFERLGLVVNKQFCDAASIQQAIHILQYAVTGEEDTGEENLVLNKIICGMPIQHPIEKQPPISDDTKQLIEGLLKAIISHWSAIGNTSVEGLRASFLCRAGRITVEEEKYVLIVEEKTYDMLLDQIPWGIRQLKLSWMEKLIEVQWRG